MCRPLVTDRTDDLWDAERTGLTRLGSAIRCGDAAGQDRIHHLTDVFDPDHRFHQLTLDEKVGCADDAERASALLDPVERVDHAAILTAAVKLRARHPHLASHLHDGIGTHLLADPGRLLAHELVV